ncbi:uncharacterized protein LOC104417023 [Eucalyptus grandis]|uniref:uncharacterized protein LOC104417023 n=1 Tax=Eucalyptus grandis TaxID=71139 RepID=UPI00192E7AA7|nr:uncharacterized protein LOC104417023 [Eucalyptus grandis]
MPMLLRAGERATGCSRREKRQVLAGSFSKVIMDCGTSSSFCSCCRWRSSSFKISLSRSPIIPIFVLFLLVPSPFFCQARSLETATFRATNQTFQPGDELQKLKMIRAHLKDINKPPLKTIKSLDGDIIDCILSHQQPAFDHPLLKGQKPLDPPKMPKGYNSTTVAIEILQPWRMSGEVCPEGTVPIRRMSEADVLRASSIQTFGKKVRSHALTDTSDNSPEYAIVYVDQDQYYGAQATINVWQPYVAQDDEISVAQLWVSAGTDGVDLNTIEVGWQVYPGLYGDDTTRLFIYWTNDDYKKTGCYNLLCPGFVQTNNGIAIGSPLEPMSSYGGAQIDITLLVWKDLDTGNWWLLLEPNIFLGYWPSVLFTHLDDHASEVNFGGEIMNTNAMGKHTSTEMGSGHFAEEGYRKAAYFQQLQVVDGSNELLPVQNAETVVSYPNCYDLERGNDPNWGYSFFYGGPGRSGNCP